MLPCKWNYSTKHHPSVSGEKTAALYSAFCFYQQNFVPTKLINSIRHMRSRCHKAWFINCTRQRSRSLMTWHDMTYDMTTTQCHCQRSLMTWHDMTYDMPKTQCHCQHTASMALSSNLFVCVFHKLFLYIFVRDGWSDLTRS